MSCDANKSCGEAVRWIETVETVRFNEIDQWGMAWHGHYLAWFEVGRVALLKQFDLLPDQMTLMGFLAPVIRLNCEYKHPAMCGDEIVIRTTALKPEIAALVFKAEIVRRHDGTLLARSETTQVLMTTDKTMIYRLSGEIETRVRRLLDFCCGS
ncbi:MAG: thioesterase family protein [Desulfosarcinaceae bacterium]